MKRGFLIVLTAIYLISCVGIGVSRFYCCGKLASVTLNYGTENKPGDKKNCCRHEQQNFKVKDSHFNVPAFSLNQPLSFVIPTFIAFDNKINFDLAPGKIVYRVNAPPGRSVMPFYISNCAYRI